MKKIFNAIITVPLVIVLIAVLIVIGLLWLVYKPLDLLFAKFDKLVKAAEAKERREKNSAFFKKQMDFFIKQQKIREKIREKFAEERLFKKFRSKINLQNEGEYINYVDA